MTPVRSVLSAVERQRGYLFLWAPVCLSVGIGGYFLLRFEPAPMAYIWLGAAALLLGLVIRYIREDLRPVLSAVLLVILGVLIIGARTHMVAEPVLGFRYYGPIEGRITKVDRSVSDKVRLTLDRVVLAKMHPDRTPSLVRVSLHGDQGFITPEPGLTVILTGHLAPPSGPVEPGGFDFQRMAWFGGLGAVGYTRTPVLSLRPAQQGRAGLWLHRLRMRISTAVQQALPGEDGAFAAAIMTGDRSGMGQSTLDNLRASNLAHLLAISGLHMGLLTGFIFAAIRYGLALAPPLALRLSIKKLAAVLALLAGAFYLALSGGNVATERAFIMVSVMFVAVLFDRRALTLRAVALAAVIVLVLRPEALTGPGFQMSFAATTGLVGVFGALRNWRGPRVPKPLRPVLAVVISSAVAGLATAPVAAVHFNRIADYGLVANLLSVPLMGVVVMPGAVLAACLAPFGLGWIGLGIMQPAIHWILGVAGYVAAMEGAVSYVPTPQAPVLPMMALGFLFLILWRGRLRLAGLAPVVLAFVLWSGVERPPLLISETGGLLGLMTPEGRVLNKPRGEGFAALSWLENDGDGALQTGASERSGLSGKKGHVWFELGGEPLVHLSGRGAAERVAEGCKSASLVILAANWDKDSKDCKVLDRKQLGRLGAVAIYETKTGLRIVGAKQQAGQRLWNMRELRARSRKKTSRKKRVQ